jgi:hypothetical protein
MRASPCRRSFALASSTIDKATLESNGELDNCKNSLSSHVNDVEPLLVVLVTGGRQRRVYRAP